MQQEEKKASVETEAAETEMGANWRLIRPDDSSQKVALCGDSVLDNFFWMSNPKQYLRPQLEQMLKGLDSGDWRCVNLAVDETSSFNLIDRHPQLAPWGRYERARQLVFDDTVPEEQQDRCYYAMADGHMRPVECLRRLSNLKAVVLSVGGNDVLLSHRMQQRLATSLLPWNYHVRLEEAQAFGARISSIAALIQEAAPEALLIPVIVYHPHYGYSLLSGGGPAGAGPGGVVGDWAARMGQRAFLSPICTPLVRELLRMAHTRGLPVIDLSRTFDPSNELHYGTGKQGTNSALLGTHWSGVEPSNVGSQFIAELVTHVLSHFKAGGGSMVYYGLLTKSGDKIERVHTEVNDEHYHERYWFAVNKCLCLKQKVQRPPWKW